MYKNKKILAVIPARGGSKGLFRKNIKLLLGKPLIAWTIEQALNSKYLDEVIVSTEDNEIAEISVKYGAKIPFLRPVELAKDDTPMIDVLIHILQNIKSYYDLIVLLEPTSPIRKRDDIDNAIVKFVDNYDKYDSLVSLGQVHLENPVIMKKIEGDYVVPFYEKLQNIYRRQDYPLVFFPYGVLYISKVENLLRNKTFYTNKTGYFFIERFQCYEIDDIYDFLAIENILKYLLERGLL
ncbi:MAG: cytidylyltransferase domain-containing protein [bacterium]